MLLALFEPDIPQNTGSLIRLGACLGVPLHLIEPCGFPVDDRKLKRVAMDYHAQAMIHRHASWNAFLDFMQGLPETRLVLLTTKTTQSYIDFAYKKGDVLLLGRESAGVPVAVHDRADEKITIPMRKEARSLNQAMAASMVLGEALRQTKGFP